MINLKINDTVLEVKEGTTILNAAASAGIFIPTLCYHKDLSPFGGCRFCVVEVQGARLPMTACNTPVAPEWRILTESPTVIRYRRAILHMLLSNYYDAGYKRVNGKSGVDEDNQLIRYAKDYHVDIASAMAKHPRYPVDSDPNPFVFVDRNKCIQCKRCVRACAEIQGRFVWSQAYRGYQACIVAGDDATMLASRCESCGACVAYCPTGALDNKMSLHAGPADRLVRTTCTYCGVGCQLDLNVRNEKVVRVTSNPDANGSSVNGMHLCVKGRYGYDFIHHPRRHTRPLVREYLLKDEPRPASRGRFVDVDWDTALDITARKLKQSAAEDTHGVGVLVSARLLNEEAYLLGRLARRLGTNNIDLAANLYAYDETEGLLNSIGLPAMSNSFDDLSSSAQAFLVIGSNLTEQHPVFGARIRQSILKRHIPMVVASPDFVNIEEYAALALRHRPGTEAALVNGLIHILLEKGVHESVTQKLQGGFDQARAIIAQYTPERVSELTAVPSDKLYAAAELLAVHRPMAVLSGIGLSDSEAMHALANLQLLLGNLGVAGGGINPLRAQNNAQGARDMGCLPAYLPGYQPVGDASTRQRFERAWGGAIGSEAGMKAAAMIGNVRSLYIVGEDILGISPEAEEYRRKLDRCDFVVVQEIALSDTTRYADVVLPGVSFAEKTGTFTSTERRVQMVRQAITPVGDSRADWQIIAGLGKRLGPGWEYASTAQIMREIAGLIPVYGGITHERLERGERLQWPVESLERSGMSILPPGLFSQGAVHWSAPGAIK